MGLDKKICRQQNKQRGKTMKKYIMMTALTLVLGAAAFSGPAHAYTSNPCNGQTIEIIAPDTSSNHTCTSSGWVSAFVGTVSTGKVGAALVTPGISSSIGLAVPMITPQALAKRDEIAYGLLFQRGYKVPYSLNDLAYPDQITMNKDILQRENLIRTELYLVGKFVADPVNFVPTDKDFLVYGVTPDQQPQLRSFWQHLKDNVINWIKKVLG
jgi:hypothetical protein